MGGDSRRRSLVKSIAHRNLAIIILALVALLITGSIQETTRITVTFNTIQVVSFYIHERKLGKD